MLARDSFLPITPICARLVNAFTGFLCIVYVHMSDAITVKVPNGSNNKITHESLLSNHGVVAYAGTANVRRDDLSRLAAQ